MPASAAELSLDAFTYDLPDELIAQKPLPVRHGSRLLHVNRLAKTISHLQFPDIATLLQPGDVLVLNDTKVIPARLQIRRQSGARGEVLLLRPETRQAGLWQAMATPLRKLKIGEEVIVECGGEDVGTLRIADFYEAEDGQRRALVDFGSQENVYDILSRQGFAPLPMYIHRDPDATDDVRKEDISRYQTIFAKAPGAVAAPTAGLHFSEEIFEQLSKRGIERHTLTLHVGPGTFKPITSSVESHTIESELFSISPETAAALNAAKVEGRRIIAVGTTSCRALESAGVSGRVEPVEHGSTSLYIRPGYPFKVIDGLVTNFHLSQSSLLVLVAAFGGYDLIMEAYRQAVAQRYRFFSYGDAMLIL